MYGREMEPLRWQRRPSLRRPIFVVAFEGWNDAGDASTIALEYLAREWGAERFATIDAEEFYDFTVTRPHVRLDEEGVRRIDWPDIELSAASVPGGKHDLVVLKGVEPQLRWKSFCKTVVEAADEVRAEMAVILGALLADVPHTRPVRVSGTTDDRDLADRLGLAAPSYEGPTGIVGVLHDSFRSAGIPAASFWAAVPHYVHQIPSPKAALALVERSAALFGATLDAGDLRRAAVEWEREVSERVADDEEASAYVAQLEDAEDTEGATEFGIERLRMGNIDDLAAEVERYLRQHRPQD
jgi:predicted ATP-grasp superfamily ATP-dependent carboligase